MLKIGLFVVNYNGISSLPYLFEKILNNLSTLKEHFYETIDVWIIDNASTDSSVKVISQYKDLKLIQLKRNIGYGPACNMAYIMSKKLGYNYDLLIFMNNDIILFYEKIVTFLQVISKLWEYYNKKFLATAILINGYDNRIDYGGLFIDNTGNTWSLRMIMKNPKLVSKYTKTLGLINVHYADGAFIALPARVFEKLGGFSSSYFMYLEDVDLSFKAHMIDIKVILIPIIIGIHYRSSSSGRVSIHTLYYVIRNTMYVVLKYLGVNSFVRSLLFYICCAVSSLFKLYLPQYFSRAFSSVSLRLRLHLYILGLKAVIDGIKMWMKEKRLFNIPKTSYFHVPLSCLIVPKSYERFAQQKLFDYILSHAFKKKKINTL